MRADRVRVMAQRQLGAGDYPRRRPVPLDAARRRHPHPDVPHSPGSRAEGAHSTGKDVRRTKGDVAVGVAMSVFDCFAEGQSYSDGPLRMPSTS